MKTNVCVLNQDLACLSAILNEVDKAAVYNMLDAKSAFRLHLLAEELCGMLPDLIENFNGRFWMENDRNKYELHTELFSDSMDEKTFKSLIELSSSGKNAAEKGFMGKIRCMVENMLIKRCSVDLRDEYDMLMDAADGDDAMMTELGSIHASWTLQQYREAAQDRKYKAVLEELEHSIVANLASDILVSVRGKNVEIVVKKVF